jgi:hypothetical protein
MNDVYVTFRIKLPAGHSSITIPVPKNFNDKIFSFVELYLMPAFMSQLAEDYGLDTDDELSDPITFKMNMKIQIVGDLHPNTITLSSNIEDTTEIMRRANIFFEAQKPAGTNCLGFFFDWTDQRFLEQPPDVTWDYFVQNIMALSYYGVPYKKEDHYDALPVSARIVDGANNYLFPIHLNEETLENLRFRMHLAPNIIVNFSTDEHLITMGYTGAQIGPRKARNQFQFLNENANNYKTFVGDVALRISLPQQRDLKMFLDTYLPQYTSDIVTIETTKKEARKNVTLVEAVKRALDKLTKITNIVTSIIYQEATKTFMFVFPNNVGLPIKLRMPTELTERLGFNIVGEIGATRARGLPVDDAPDFDNAMAKARALVFDTGMVVVSDENSRSMMTADMYENFVANLMPHSDGVLKLSSFSDTRPKMRLPSVFTGSSDKIPASFRLHRYFDNGNRVSLQWLEDAFVVGVLRGSDM